MSLKNTFYRFSLKLGKPGVVLYGHNATHSTTQQLLPSLHLTAAELERSIKQFLELGVDLISMQTLLEISEKGFKHPKPWVHFSFDDGYKENLTTILPVFEKYNVPFTVFISSNHIQTYQRFYSFRLKLGVLNTNRTVELLGEKIMPDLDLPARNAVYERLWTKVTALSKTELNTLFEQVDSLLEPEEKQALFNHFSSDDILTIEELKELAASNLVHIGSHCHNHVILNKQVDLADADFELSESKKWLGNTLGKEITTFCYPNGTELDYTAGSVEASKKYYKLCFTTLHGFVNESTNPLLIPRAFLLPDISSLINRMVFPDSFINMKVALMRLLRL